jgi:hypothetical protein
MTDHGLRRTLGLLIGIPPHAFLSGILGRFSILFEGRCQGRSERKGKVVAWRVGMVRVAVNAQRMYVQGFGLIQYTKFSPVSHHSHTFVFVSFSIQTYSESGYSCTARYCWSNDLE